MQLDEYNEACVLPLTTDGAPIAMSLFDPSEELIWSASGSGMIYSHLLPTAEPYSAFRVDESGGSPALGLFPNPFGLIALTHDTVRFFTKGGLSQAEVRLEQLQGNTCGCLTPSSSSARLAIVSAYNPEAPTLSLLDLTTATIATSLAIDMPATLARYEQHSSLLLLSGADGSVSAYDLRAGGTKPAGRCTLFPSKANIVCDFDVAGSALCASALRSQLGPLGSPEFAFDTTMRTLDLRTMRPTAEVFFGLGAMRVKWYFGGGAPRILAASASGELHLLEARAAAITPRVHRDCMRSAP